ncbi:MAG: tyrosine-type recombinase/integrase [Acinetobacter sp.]|uniref:tyrosine-type recombinase/integrase n=1 Tax=Acinetobacter sp. TaxID=472 RepID=UPI00258BD81A|nr:site-specific integrase [Acinetobacter sp.]MCE1271432.1 tyrosine-type recombinase/integrase [Acinetobacter sp.]
MAVIENKIKVLQLKSLTAEQANTYIGDGGGLKGKVRLARNGRISVDFIYQYRFGGKVREKRCGSWPEHELSAIRSKRNQLRSSVKQGIDPIQAEADEQLKRELENQTKEGLSVLDERLTIKELFEMWKKTQLCNRKDKGESVERSFNKDVLPSIGYLVAEEVKRIQISKILHLIVERGSKRMANVVLSDLRQFFGYAIGAGLLENDPTSRLTKASFGGQELPRDRFLTDDEIALLDGKLVTSSLSLPYKLAILVMLGTLARVGELLRTKVSDINLTEGLWQIPKGNSKNGKEHTIHLSSFTVNCFKQILEVNFQNSIWLFPNVKNDGHVDVKTLTKQIGDRQRVDSILQGRAKDNKSLVLPGGRWTPHDLRRTGATIMGNLNVRPDIIEKCLNHVDENKVRGTYQKQTLMSERKEAFDKLGIHLAALIRLVSVPYAEKTSHNG